MWEIYPCKSILIYLQCLGKFPKAREGLHSDLPLKPGLRQYILEFSQIKFLKQPYLEDADFSDLCV